MSPALDYGERLRRTERFISFIRLGVVTFNSVLYLSFPQVQDRRGLALAIIVIAEVYALVTVFYNPERLAPTVVPVVNMVLDNLLIALWLHATGGYQSPFFPLFYAEAAASVGRFGWIMGSLSAVGSALLYGLVVAVDDGAPMYHVLTRIGYIFVIVAFVAYVVEAARRVERDAAVAEAAAEAYAELSRLKAGFLTTVTHELRTPLTTIKGATGTLLREDVELDPAEARSLLEMVDRQSGRLAKLIQDLIDMASLERGQLSFQLEPTDIVALVQMQAGDFQSSVGRRIKIDSGGVIPVVVCDPPLISRAVHNLIDNAVKFSPEDSEIEIVIHDLGHKVAIDVIDRGIGISIEEQRRIFDRFYQVDSSMTRKAYGTGVGLNIALELVRMHRGDLEVDSEPGKGSRFRMTLPKEQNPLALEARESRSA
ncbi:MAG: sensor histidine kinase [Actinomycetota bacterium]